MQNHIYIQYVHIIYIYIYIYIKPSTYIIWCVFFRGTFEDNPKGNHPKCIQQFPPWKCDFLWWHPKVAMENPHGNNRKYIFKRWIFSCHVSFQGGYIPQYLFGWIGIQQLLLRISPYWLGSMILYIKPWSFDHCSIVILFSLSLSLSCLSLQRRQMFAHRGREPRPAYENRLSSCCTSYWQGFP